MKRNKVLIVEDDPVSRGVVEKLLQRSGYETWACADAREAMICLREAFFDILMTDLCIPGEDGLALIEKARLFHPGIKTMLITGHLNEEVKEKGLTLGVDGLFHKPISWEKLFAFMETLSGSKKERTYLFSRKSRASRIGRLTRRTVLAFILLLLPFLSVYPSTGAELLAVQYRSTFRTEVRRDCIRSLSGLLTPEQLKRVRELQDAFYAEASPVRRDLFIASMELRQLLSDPEVDPHIVFDRHKKILELQSKLEHLSLSYLIRARSVLTDSQLDRLPQDCMLGMGTELGINIGIGRAPRRGYRR